MKKSIISFILGAVIFSCITAYATNANFIEVFYNVDKIVIDGNVNISNQKLFIHKGSVYVPLRFIAENFGKKVEWDNDLKTVYIGENIKEKEDEEVYEKEEYKLKISNGKEKLDSLCYQLDQNDYSKNIEELLVNFEKNIDGEKIQYVYFGKEKGKMYCKPDVELPESYDFRERPWYTFAKENGYYISQVYTNYVDNSKYVTIAKAIYENEEFVGVVGIDLILDEI